MRRREVQLPRLAAAIHERISHSRTDVVHLPMSATFTPMCPQVLMIPFTISHKWPLSDIESYTTTELRRGNNRSNINANNTAPCCSFGIKHGPKTISETGQPAKTEGGSPEVRSPPQPPCWDTPLTTTSTLVWICSSNKCLQCFAMDTRLFMELLAGWEQGRLPRWSNLRSGIALTSSSRSSSESLYAHRGSQATSIYNQTICVRNKSGRMNAASMSKWPAGLIESDVRVWCDPLCCRDTSIGGKRVLHSAAWNSNVRLLNFLDWMPAMVPRKGECVVWIACMSSDSSEGNVNVGSGTPCSGSSSGPIFKTKDSKFGS